MRRVVRSTASPLAAAVLVAAALAGGGGVAPTAWAGPGKGVVRVTRLDGPPVEGEFQAVSAEGIRLASALSPIPLASVREARFGPDGPLAALDAGVGLVVVLVGGETIRGALSAGSAEGIDVKPPDFPALHLPFEAVRRIEAETAHRSVCDEPSKGRPPRAGTDIAYSRSGDAFPGTVAAAGGDGIAMEAQKDRRTTVSWSDLVVVHLDNPSKTRPAGLVAEIETLGGSILLATHVQGDAKELTGTLVTGMKVVVPTGSLRAIRWSGGEFVYACDLPFESTYTPWYPAVDDKAGAGVDTKAILDRWNAARADRTSEGCPLSVAGVRYRHGIWVWPRSAVKIPLGKAFTRFEARFGIDDDLKRERKEGAQGDVTARVLADGKEVWTSGGSVKGGEPARAVGPIDVTGVTTLVLEVDFGADLQVNDASDWADPVLVRAP